MLYTKYNVSIKNNYLNSLKFDKFFSKVFFSVFFFIVADWDKLDPNIRNISSVAVFKSNILKFMNQSKIIVLTVSNLKDKTHEPPMSKSQSYMKSAFQNHRIRFLSAIMLSK